MTFKDVIIKNFKGDLNKYVSLFFSGVFCVAMFFTYSTLILLDEISESVETYPMEILMIVTCLMVCLFSIFFISYSYGNFVRNKKKELATYMMLGMNEREGMILLLVETVVIAVPSILTGMISGVVFSRMFQIIALKIIDIDNIKYQLSPMNFIITFLAFALIYAGCTFVALIKLKKQDITSIIKDSRKKEEKGFGKKDVVLFLAGLVLTVFSIVFVLRIAGDSDINYKLWVVLTFVLSGYLGIYFIIVHGISCVIELKRLSKKYYDNMLSVSGMDYKFKQNTKVIVILAMLASMIVLLVGSPIALLNISSDIAEDANSDIEYMITGNTPVDVESVLADNIKDEKVTWVSYVLDGENKIHPVMATSDYNERFNASINVKNGETAIVNITWVPGTIGYEVGQNIGFETAEGSIEYKISEFTKGDFFCVNLFNGGTVYLISDEDYEKLDGVIYKSQVHEITCNDSWKNSEAVVDELTEKIGENGVVNSRIEQYIILKHGYGIFLFVSCSMCFMFFISTGFVLYFKQYNDIDEDKQQYIQLYKIGISDRAVKKSIKKKMSVVYFTPLIGSIMGISIMYYLSNLFGGTDIVKVFMSKSYIGLALYATSQILFYFLLKNKYTRDVLSVDEA